MHRPEHSAERPRKPKIERFSKRHSTGGVGTINLKNRPKWGREGEGGMDKKDLQDALEYLGMAEELRPVAEKLVETIISYGPYLRKIVEAASNATIEMRISHVRKFEDAGFTREEAIFLTMDEWWGYRRMINENSQKSK